MLTHAMKTTLDELYTEAADHLNKALTLIEQGRADAYTVFSRVAQLSPDALATEIEAAYLDTVRAVERIREIRA
ncbi:MAG TPA: hypothetical protein VJ914_04470 [Pseudonocardiaceae bacterium]|nr:hypothetical protein [Pseudonocardiaceae bacterium]